MKLTGISDPVFYLQHVRSDAAAWDDLVSELTIGETYFFREPAQFEFIRRVILPEIVHRRGPDHRLRLWSAACASGEEAYSLAIVLEEAGLAGRAHLLATDVSRAALAKARRMTYSAWSLRGEGAEAARPYLLPVGGKNLFDVRIARSVTFEYVNLALDAYPSIAAGIWGMDLILCRNVLIYFDPATVRSVVRRLYDSLAPGGWLVTASSDPPPEFDAPYEAVVRDGVVCYRRPLGAEAEAEIVRGPHALLAGPHRAAAPTPLVASPPPAVCRSPVEEAGGAFARGDYARAAELTADLAADSRATALHVRSVANVEAGRAERICADAALRHPLTPELHFLHAVLLFGLGRDAEAGRAAKRVVYLDRSLAAGHFTLGTVLCRLGDHPGARRAYRNARDLCAARPPGEAVPLADGELAGRMATAAAVQLKTLDATERVRT
jgi:chemotaxis protein methyltransferase CheR